LTGRHESIRENAWSIEFAEPEFIERLLHAIVGFEIKIDRVEGKWKLNQNHPEDRREQLARGLRDSGGHDELRIAELMETTLTKPAGG
jgi:transcriptional regulator